MRLKEQQKHLRKHNAAIIMFLTETSGYCEIQGFTRRLFHIKANEWNQMLSYLLSDDIYKTPKTVGGTVGDAESKRKMRKSSVNRVNLNEPSRKRNHLIWVSLSKCTDSAGNTTSTLGQYQTLMKHNEETIMVWLLPVDISNIFLGRSDIPEFFWLVTGLPSVGIVCWKVCTVSWTVWRCRQTSSGSMQVDTFWAKR